MVDKYETKFDCGDGSVLVTVHSDGTLELTGYDEEHEQAAQEFGYERSACGNLVELWRDDDLSTNKVYALYLFLMPTVDHAVQFTAETVQHATQMLPDYSRTDPPLEALQYAKADAGVIISQILETIELKRSGKLAYPQINRPNMHSWRFYLLEKMEDEFLSWSGRHRYDIDRLASNEYDSSRPATTSYLDAIGYLCKGAKYIDELNPESHELKELEEVILKDLFESANKALWGITFSKNRRRGSDFRNTVDWFIGRFVKFMREHP